jgi:hypothetical protein
LAKLDFYSKEIAKIQEDLFVKIDSLVKGLSQVTDTELIRLAKQIDFFEEMERLGYSQLINKVGKTYDDEIAAIFGELSRRELAKVPAASIQVLQGLRDLDMAYLTSGVRQYSDNLKAAMIRSIITGETNQQVMENLTRGFGVGTYISSSEVSFLINDGLARFSNASRAKAFEQFPDVKFKYIGTNDDKTRDVCRKALKEKPLTRKEIDKLGYVTFSGRGGYNCRHDWVRAL